MMWPFNKKAAGTGGSLTAFVRLGSAIWSGRNYSSFAKEAYVRNVVAYRCIRMIAEAASDVPWLIYVNKKEIDDHPFHSILESPNPTQGGVGFFDEFYSYLQIAGNAYINAISVNEGQIDALDNLRPDRMKGVVENNRLVGWEYGVSGQTQKFMLPIDTTKQAPILHFANFHPTEDVLGMSPIEAAAYSIDVHNSASAFNKAILDNVATPSGALQTEKDLSEDQFQRLKMDLEERQGQRGAGKPLLLEGGMTWKAMAFSPKDLDFVEGKREAAREVALGFGVPPMLLGIAGDATHSNYKEANRAFWRQTVLPLVGRSASHLTTALKPTYGKGFRLSYNPDGIEALAEERKELWDRVRFSTWLTIDEKRAATGYTPLPDGKGEVLFIPTRDQPLDQALQPKDPAPENDVTITSEEDVKPENKPKPPKKPEKDTP